MKRFRNQIILTVGLVLALGLFLGSNMLFAESAKDEQAETYQKAWLGVYMQDLTEDIAEALGIEVEEGVLINDVIEDSPADKAGLEDGDVIVRLGSDVVDDAGDLSKAIKSRKPGEKVDLVIYRDGEKKDFSVVLGESQERKDRRFSLEAPKAKQYRQFFKEMTSGGYLGVVLQSLSDQLADYFEVDDGVLITEVEKDSPADKAGLKAGDVIVALNGKEVSTPSGVSSMIRKYEEGEKVDIEVVRKGAEMQFTAEIAEREFDDDLYGLFGGENWEPGILHIPDPHHFQWNFDPDDFEFDYEEFNKEFGEEFREEMEELREEINELRDELQELKKDLD
ncbi:MAG: PDZ domain-containing protein [candidate division Zixibacteria bacterium]|nr:PDZ domain-containing protein [candidate division Zixibacteria bacterium]NIR63481.1 PDZ domain-containing protein [candidate division Zixibacteria bacterium]NIS17724.1 PDZ domain-containing protein [candidate division Zixibacteria bacterium]NIS45436.1 PDZ domain-containing protein [candidate division Zixibacteria bacterium]NIT54040.1 PDZ domain-containing protein [candidate division Zixibacteria bacterium]